MITKVFPYKGAKYRIVRYGIEYHVEELKRVLFAYDWELLYYFDTEEKALEYVKQLCNQPNLKKEVISYHSPYNS